MYMHLSGMFQVILDIDSYDSTMDHYLTVFLTLVYHFVQLRSCIPCNYTLNKHYTGLYYV